MKKSKQKITKNLSFSIDVNKVNLNCRKFNSSEISRGTGIEKNKKGKGSYTRKHVKLDDDSCGLFLT
ncbi:hypothetical protein [Candidatus Clostridium stratigraminis]|uniref:Ribosome alternative rescue factor ArfA n=1 Tax=Candidatus Clostridium stratigraminis TaxID=3381661 RepID=A0ABW8T1V9_9CLOT